MRIISLLVAFCFTFNVMASTGTVQELERVLDDYQYSLSVEWDQKDSEFYDVKTKEFFGKLERLIKEEGLTQDQMMSLIEKKANNPSVINALKLKLSLLDQGSSTDDLVALIKDSTKDLYSQGASWNGQVVYTVIAGLLVAAIVGYSIWFDVNHECVSYDTQYVCHTVASCTGSYFDSYTGVFVQCTPWPQTVCGWNNYCTSYKKK